MSDLISRQKAIAHLKHRLYETQFNNDTEHPYYEEIADNRIETWMNELPSVQPTEASCWGCNCPKMERLKEQKTFSEMVHLHDTKTNSCDTISRQAAIDAMRELPYGYRGIVWDILNSLPSEQPEQKHGEWEEKYIENAEPLFHRRFYCSACGRWQTYGKTEYCPKCGARMDGDTA